MQVFLISNPSGLQSHLLGKLNTALTGDNARYWSLKELEKKMTISDSLAAFQSVQTKLCTPMLRFADKTTPSEELVKAHKLYIAGGNSLDYLKAMRQSSPGYPSLAEKMQSKRHLIPTTIVGCSAGAMVMGRNVKGFGTMLGGIKNPDDRRMKALGLLRCQIIPHYGNIDYPASQVENMIEQFASRPDVTDDTDRRFILLRDNAMLHIDFDKSTPSYQERYGRYPSRTAEVFGEAYLLDINQGTFETLTDEKLADEVVW